MRLTGKHKSYREVRFTENPLQTTKKRSLSLFLTDYILVRELPVSYFVVFFSMRLKCVCTKKTRAFLLQNKEQINIHYNRQSGQDWSAMKEQLHSLSRLLPLVFFYLYCLNILQSKNHLQIMAIQYRPELFIRNDKSGFQC